MNAEIRIHRPASNALVQDVLAGVDAALRLYRFDWRDPEAYRTRAAEIDREDLGWLDAVRAHGPAAEAQLDRLREEGGYVVTTGQQPGLFSGPLFTLYKALTAVRLAEQLEAELGRPVVALFWVASEDHDWDEAHHTWVIGTDNELHRVSVDAVEGSGSQALHRVALEGEGAAAVEALRPLLPDSDFSGELLEALQNAYGEGATLPSGFEATMAHLLEPFGVLFTSADDPVVKQRSLKVLRSEATSSALHQEKLSARSRELESLDYPVQVGILEGGVNLFLDGPGGRERLYRDGDGFILRHSETRVGADELARVLSEEPGRVSPNVLLRPVCEAEAFPTLAYVAGPGEGSYWAQLQPLFEAIGTGMPVVHPRMGATVVEGKIQKVLDKFGLDEDRLRTPFHELAQELARDEVPDDVREALGKIRGAIGQGSGELTEAARNIDPTLKGPIGHARGAAFEAFADAEKKILQALKRENEIALQQVEKAQLHLFPNGSPQERVLNASYYLARFGASFLQSVYDAMPDALPTEALQERG